MNVQIPIAGLTLSDGQTYNGQLPVWATRPLMIRVSPDFTSGNEYPVYIQVVDGGGVKKLVTLPYQEELDVDLSFAAPLLTRADRNKSQGDPAFPKQEVTIWSTSFANRITLPVFHCDETYWDTLGVDGALPQPPKPRIPNQTLDIYFPYRIHPLDAFQVEVEPVTGASSDVIFPTTYVLGNTIDITYIKKLTIKNVWGSGLDQVINYEDKLHSDVIYDESLQCALRARWNMRNGQWFWAAFKDYFWYNKSTPIRGHGGVTEQAEITINLEYGEEYYNVYQELLVSSNIVFDLNIPGINQYQSKRFRVEVSGDTGARWSNSTKTYRQQVRFRTTELQDNYIFLQQPDQPPTPSIAFSAQKNPWTVPAAYTEGLINSIYSNAAWEVQSTPAWLSVGDMITLTAADFEQGSLLFALDAYWETFKVPSTHNIRSKAPIFMGGRGATLRANVPGYKVQAVTMDRDGIGITATSSVQTGEGVTLSIPAAQYFILKLSKDPSAPIVPADASAAQISVSVNRFNGNGGTSNLTATVAANTGEERTGNIVLKSLAGSTTYTIPIIQQKASISLNPANPANIQVGNGVQVGRLITEVTANTSWTIDAGYPSWITPTSYSGASGTSQMFVDIQANTGAQRTAYITLRSAVNTSVTAILSVYQAGATGNISVDTPTFNVDYLTHPVTVNVTSFGNWSVSARDTWITPNKYAGANGTTTVELTIGDNTSNDARTGTITFYNDLTGNIAVVTVNQTGAPVSISLTPSKVTGPKDGADAKPVTYVSDNNWIMGGAPSWVFVSPTSGGSGTGIVGIVFDTPNNTGAKRSGYLRLENTTTHEIAICIIEQEG